MHNNYLLLENDGESTLPRESAFHAAGHALGEHLFNRTDIDDFWRYARLRATEAGTIEALAEVVTSLSFDVDIAVAQGANTLPAHPWDEHLEHLIGRNICSAPGHRGIAWVLLDDESWFESAEMMVLQRHWWAVSNLAERSIWARPLTRPPLLDCCGTSAAAPTPGSEPRSRTASRTSSWSSPVRTAPAGRARHDAFPARAVAQLAAQPGHDVHDQAVSGPIEPTEGSGLDGSHGP